jgi:ABC-type nitrate/sulfonate/bicarbonate transport system substrate-binding protein
MIFGAHPDTIAQRPDLCRTILRVHRQASEYAMANRDAMIEVAVAKLGQRRDALEVSAPNVELNWQMTPEMLQRARTYAEHMQSLRQIRHLPDFASFFDTRFSDEMARGGA